jgi:hypothetical protein
MKNTETNSLCSSSRMEMNTNFAEEWNRIVNTTDGEMYVVGRTERNLEGFLNSG